MLKRILRGVGANGFSQLVTIAVQLLSVPVFLSIWSLDQYGHWLVITAIPAYLAMSDLGVVAVAANKMTMLVADHRSAQALRVFRSAQVFLTLTGGAVTVLSAVILLFPMLPGVDKETTSTLFVLIVALVVGQAGGLGEAILRATSRFATGVLLSTACRLSEWLGYIVGLYLGGTYTSVALGGLVARALVTTILLVLAGRGQDVFQYGFRGASRAELRSLLGPAFGFMTVTATNALTIQGFTLLAGIFLGPATVVLFNTYRTLSRLGVQASSALSHSVWPEFSRIFGQSDKSHLERVYRRTRFTGSMLATVISLVTWFVAPYFLALWTHDRVGFVPVLMLLFLAYAAIVGTAHTPRVLLMATNTHAQLAGWGAAISFASIILAASLATILDVYGLAIAMLTGELAMLILVLYIARRFLTRSFPSKDVINAR